MARRLHDHALSVETAATYIDHYKIGIEEYSSRWESCDAGIFDNSELKQVLTKSVTLVIDRLDSETQNFLFTCAFLDSGCVWSDLFPDISIEEFNTYAAELGKFSLIERVTLVEAGDEGFSVHPAIHAIARITLLGQSNAGQIINLAINNVGYALPDDHDGAASAEQARFLPHVKQCKESLMVMNRRNIPIAPENLPILGILGSLLQRRGQLDDAETFYSCALFAYEAQQPVRSSIKQSNEVQDQTSEEDVLIHREPDYYLIINNYGMVLKARGNIEEAEKCFEMIRQSIDMSSQADVSNLANVDSKINLALVLRQQGRLNEATALLEEQRLLYKKQRGDEAIIHIAKINQYLGTIDKWQGQYWQASLKIKGARASLHSMLGSESLDVAIANKELAAICLLYDPAKLSEAEEHLNNAEVGIKKHCEPNSRLYLDLQWHRLTLRLMQCRMPQHSSDTSIEKVCSDFDAFIARLETLLGQNDSVTLHNTRTYGRLLCKIGNFEAGEQKLLRAINGYEVEGLKHEVEGRKVHFNRIDQAFANKDLADQYFIYSTSLDENDRKTAAGIDYLSTARKHYQEAQTLFHPINSEYVQDLIENIQRKLTSIESILGGNQRTKTETVDDHAPNQSQRDESVNRGRASMVGSEIHASNSRSCSGAFRRIIDYIGTSKSRADN